MMKRVLAVLCLCLLAVMPVGAVLKEKDLAQTLGVLRAELERDYQKLQMFIQSYEQQGAQQHQQLVSYMNQCEQIGLMLYSQSTENTFDMAYACQQSVDLYRRLNDKEGNTLPYDKIIARLKSEIERYDALIASLKSMPPVAKHDEEVLTQSDSILLQAIDSLASKIDSLAETADEQQAMPLPLHDEEAEEDEPQEPLYLTGQQLEDRKACLEYAEALREIMAQHLESMEAESTYYKSVQEKVERLNAFAQMQYKMLQDRIFKQGGTNYFAILAALPRYIALASSTAKSKYTPFEGKQSKSEWRGLSIAFITIFVLLYLSLSMAVSYAALRWLVPRRWMGDDAKTRRKMLTLVVGTALFGIIVMALRSYMPSNSVRMGAGLIINTTWLMEVIFLSLYIRLKGSDMLHATLTYLPLLILSFIVVIVRILLIPNIILSLAFPPVLLGFTLWQLWLARKYRKGLPMLDVAYSYITSIAMVVSTIAAWVGFTMMAVQIMVWWTFQLAAITTITCFYDIMEMYERRHLARKIARSLVAPDSSVATRSELLKQIQQGDHITSTWIYDLVSRTIVPIMAVASVLASIYWAAALFEMTSVCQKAFYTNFIDQKDLIQVSLFKLCQVAALWFIFRYINYAVRSFYAAYRRHTANPDDVLNLTLARNVIAILSWGLYVIIVFVILNVPKSGISIVTAGLATGLGFAMQDLIENFFYGLSLMTGRLRVGDYIECDGITGKVESITYQSTQVITGDGCVIAFLNKALFSKNFKNMTRNHSYELISIPVGVAYGTNVERVRQLLIEALTPICQETNDNGQNVSDPERPIMVRFADFGDSSVDLKVMVWMLVEEKYALMARIKEAIYNTLNTNNIEIPFPQRDVHMR